MKKLFYLIFIVLLVGCSNVYQATDIMDCFGKDGKQLEECQE